ncbi:tRNA pseudouridine(13) synthase TruD [Methanosarcinales archaeon]|nr:MAG: tRNA pseudouridine(13) synthase TruD [Methanosarcinales archaeon]
MRRSPKGDREIGILIYATDGDGIGGRLKVRAEDFVVNEISEIETGEKGDYIIVEVRKVNWDTHILVKNIAKKLRISKHRISFAGTKDKFAVTTQKMSIKGVYEEDIRRIRIKDVDIRVLGRARRHVYLGDLIGNDFDIVVRDVSLPADEIRRRIDRIYDEIGEIGGFPNFFGVQRFGAVRPLTHIVGKHILRGNVREAVMCYLTDIFEGESDAAKEARRTASEDFKSALNAMPLSLKYERAMLDVLIKRGCTQPEDCTDDDFIAALRVLPLHLRKMFVHAYQAYLFNLVLSKRIERGIPLNSAEIGEFVCFTDRYGLPSLNGEKVERVTADNEGMINMLLKRRRAFVVAPLFGHESVLSGGIQGEIEREVLNAEKISTSDFLVEKIPELRSEGHFRNIAVHVNIERVDIGDDELYGDKKVRFKFFLPKASYATVVMREFMK